jgi:Skp family chaperone for outer membrane proteins
MRKISALIAGLVLASSCSYFEKKEPSDGRGIVIRYMNLKAVYTFVLNRNRDATEVKKQAEKKIARMKELDRELDEPGTDHVALLDEYRQIKSEAEALKSKSKDYKAKLLNQINRAVKNISAKIKVDLILNIGDELIYAKKEYDITEDIMREIIRLDERQMPESR